MEQRHFHIDAGNVQLIEDRNPFDLVKCLSGETGAVTSDDEMLHINGKK
jgi:hypothetical protein